MLRRCLARAWSKVLGVTTLLVVVTLFFLRLKILFPSKTLWDYLEVFIAPFLSALIVALLVLFLEMQAKAREERQTQERERIREQANKEEALQRYFDRISALVMDKQVIVLAKAAARLGGNYRDPIIESARDVIRARTLSILRIFSRDEEKKTAVVRFLIESRIFLFLGISLAEADLSRARLSSADLSTLDLSNVDLSGAELSFAKLFGSDLTHANLSDTDMIGANLGVAHLSQLLLDLRRVTSKSLYEYPHSNRIATDLSGATLWRANLRSANLSEAKLCAAKLNGADLSLANLSGADLRGANLEGANLQDVRWDDYTSWPELKMLEKAKNVPIALGNMLGI